MVLKVVLCVFAVVGQSFAGPWLPWGPPSCNCDAPDISVPVHNCEGITISEIDSYPSYKPISKIHQSSYKPISVSYSEESYRPISVSYSEVESYKPISVSSPMNNNGGALIVTSVGPITPFGIGVASDISLTGELELFGAMPYLSAVAFEGQFDTSGAAPVEYGCGDCVAITEEIGGRSGCSKH